MLCVLDIDNKLGCNVVLVMHNILRNNKQMLTKLQLSQLQKSHN